MMTLMRIACLCGWLAAAPLLSAQQDWVVTARTIYTAAGNPIENGFVAVSGGTIDALGPGRGGGGDVLEVDSVTPGLIDLSVRIDTGDCSVEQSTEAAIELSVADSLDLYSHRWARELRSGVTSVLATPDDDDVIGGLAVVLKTGGAPTLEARLLKADAVLRASMGSQPSEGNQLAQGGAPRSFYVRRPTTRMGVEWVFRKAYYDAIAAERTGEVADELERERHEVLRRTLQGELPVAVQAWATQDVRTAIYLKEEFGIPRMFVDAAAEAWREPELLVRSGMAVVLPPHNFNGRFDGDFGDGAFFAWDSAARLHERGVMLALSGHGSRDVGARLARQAGFAMRGGLPFEAALAAVTINPARMVGVDDRVGSLEVGKDADLVLWSGRPFEPSSQILGVLLNGELVVDPRE